MAMPEQFRTGRRQDCDPAERQRNNLESGDRHEASQQRRGQPADRWQGSTAGDGVIEPQAIPIQQRDQFQSGVTPALWKAA